MSNVSTCERLSAAIIAGDKNELSAAIEDALRGGIKNDSKATHKTKIRMEEWKCQIGWKQFKS